MIKKSALMAIFVMGVSLLANAQKYSDGRLDANMRMEARDHGIVLSYGIRPDEPGFKSFIIAPYIKTLDWVKCEYQSPYGLIVSNWSKKDDVLMMSVTVPVNTTATVYVPGNNITEGGLPAAEAKGVTFLRMEKDKAVFTLNPGSYEFVSKNYRGKQ